jgi:hypothetical protein
MNICEACYSDSVSYRDLSLLHVPLGAKRSEFELREPLNHGALGKVERHGEYGGIDSALRSVPGA